MQRLYADRCDAVFTCLVGLSLRQMAETSLTPPLPNELPVVPLRGSVVLPLTVAPLGVNRAMSVEAVNKALTGDRMVLLLLQNGEGEEPGPDDLNRIGTVAIIRQMAKGPGGMRVLVEGIVRARAEFLQNEKGYLSALIKPLPETAERSLEIDAHVRRLQELVDRAMSVATGLSPDIRTLVVVARRSAAHRVSARKPARHEGGGQAAAARGEQHLDQARRRRGSPLARDRRARVEGPDRVARREGDDGRAAPVLSSASR